MSGRAIAPVIGIVTVIGISILLAATVLVFAYSDTPSAYPQVQLDGSVDAEENVIIINHAGGDPLPVEDIDIRITVDDTPLRHQPPVPFVGAPGFKHTPHGPLNDRSDEWAPGVQSRLTLADNNEPLPTADSIVHVRVAMDGVMIAEATLEDTG